MARGKTKISDETLKVDSLSQQAYSKIKEDILTGIFKWGERLEIVDLANRFGVSRAPVIKAIERLSLEHLVTIIPNKGSYVYKPTLEDVKAVHEIRIMMEETACKLAISKNHDILVAQLQHIQSIQETVKFNYKTYLHYDRRFHHLIVKLSNNPQLLSMYQNIRAQSELFRSNTFTEAKIQRALDSHAKIFEAIKQNNIQDLIKHITEHLTDAYADCVLSLVEYDANNGM